jgi:hypothetical protein
MNCPAGGTRGDTDSADASVVCAADGPTVHPAKGFVGVLFDMLRELTVRWRHRTRSVPKAVNSLVGDSATTLCGDRPPLSYRAR